MGEMEAFCFGYSSRFAPSMGIIFSLPWEQKIPCPGNKRFPGWERRIPSMGIIARRASVPQRGFSVICLVVWKILCIFATECNTIKLNSMATIVRKPASFRLRADLLEGLKRNAARENRTLNNYVESVLLDIVYHEPNQPRLPLRKLCLELNILKKNSTVVQRICLRL